MSKTFIFIGMTIGSVIGGYIPVLFGASMLSSISIITSGIGSIIGIYLGYKLGNF